LIIQNCQEIIDTNEIFIEGDKDSFLKEFVQPSLRFSSPQISRRAEASFDDEAFKLTLPKTYNDKADPTVLKVTFRSGLVIADEKAITTFVKAGKELGFEKVKNLPFGKTIVSDKSDVGQTKAFKEVPGTPYFINSNNSTIAKKAF
jgi:hypothetical protein